ncbi:MAG: branched-chain amino acid ABC transporter permease [Proteobacteria bacterium]|nr:branched-chain amino acid ABC transporter permease [Pseudomonadota bacterium]
MYFLNLVISGLAVGSLYALIALGFVLIYKGTGVINFAQGEAIMVAAFVAYYVVKWGLGRGLSLEIAFFAAVGATLIVSALLGVFTERLVIRPMLGEPVFAVVMVTIGLSIFLRSMAGIVFGPHNYIFPNPFPDQPLQFGSTTLVHPDLWSALFTPFADQFRQFEGITLRHTHLWSMIVSFALMIAFFVFFKFARLGLGMRATANDQETATLMGVNIKRVYALTWGISFVIAGAAGIFLANVMVLNVGLAFVAINAFPAVILGGLESVPGAIIGGLIIGVLENLAGGYLENVKVLGGGLKNVVPFVILFLVLMIRPYGLFGTKEVERV